MQVIKIVPKVFASNCYLLTADGENAVAIDPSVPAVLEEAARRNLTIRYVLLTHGHFDHIGGCAALQAAGAKVGCLEKERALALGKDNLGELFSCMVPPFSVDFTFQDEDTLALCGLNIRVLSTPGHTAGSCCYLCEDAMFTGDTLFCGAVGRTDLPTSDGAALARSLRKLKALAGDYTLYAGHGEDSTLEGERTRNPYLKSC